MRSSPFRKKRKRINKSNQKTFRTQAKTSNKKQSILIRILDEFISGCLKLIGWGLPLSLFLFLYDMGSNYIDNNLINPKLEVGDIQIGYNTTQFKGNHKKYIKSRPGTSIYKEDVEQKKSFFAYKLDLCINVEKTGTIGEAYIAYRTFDDNLDTPLNEGSIYRVNSSKDDLKVTVNYNTYREHEPKRIYLILIDSKDREKQVYCIYLEGGELEYTVKYDTANYDEGTSIASGNCRINTIIPKGTIKTEYVKDEDVLSIVTNEKGKVSDYSLINVNRESILKDISDIRSMSL